MKVIYGITFFLVILSCGGALPVEKKILGDWEIISWIDTRTNEDQINGPDSVRYRVIFKPDTVFVSEKYSSENHDYKFKWQLQNDTLQVGSIGMFKIVSINRNNCELELTTFDDFFSENSKLHKEMLVLKKTKQ